MKFYQLTPWTRNDRKLLVNEISDFPILRDTDPAGMLRQITLIVSFHLFTVNHLLSLHHIILREYIPYNDLTCLFVKSRTAVIKNPAAQITRSIVLPKT